MKGLKGDELKEEIDVFLRLIQMEDKRNKQARTLSGGMKRKLAVCVALCGKSKVPLSLCAYCAFAAGES